MGADRHRPANPGGREAYSSRANGAYLRRRGIACTIPEPADQQQHRKNRDRRGGRPPRFSPDDYLYVAISARVESRPRIVEQVYLGSEEEVGARLTAGPGEDQGLPETEHRRFGDWPGASTRKPTPRWNRRSSASGSWSPTTTTGPLAQVIDAYRSQEDLAAGFRQAKDPHVVSFAPIRHFTDHKIRVHLFTCVLAPTIAHLMRREATHADRYTPKR